MQQKKSKWCRAIIELSIEDLLALKAMCDGIKSEIKDVEVQDFTKLIEYR